MITFMNLSLETVRTEEDDAEDLLDTENMFEKAFSSSKDGY